MAAGFTSEPFTGGPATVTQDQDFTLDTISVHLDDTARVTQRLSVNAGVGSNGCRRSKGAIAWPGGSSTSRSLPRCPASARTQPPNTGPCSATTSWGFRAPQVWGYGSAATAGHGLVFEDGRSAELGTRVQALAGFAGAVTLWHNDYDDFGVDHDGSYNNLGEITARGVDFELEWDAGRVWEPLTGLSFFAGLTLQNSELGSGPFDGNDVPYAWHDKASWRVRYARWGWSATLGGTYVGDSYSDEANTVTPSADGRLG